MKLPCVDHQETVQRYRHFMAMLRRPAWFSLLIIVFWTCHDWSSLASNHFVYMTNHCSKSMDVHTSLLLALTAPGNLPTSRDRDFVHCDLDLVAPRGMKLFAHFLQLGISPDVDHSDRLQLYDVTPNNTRLTPIKGLYGRLDRSLSLFDLSGSQVQDFRTIGNKMKIDYLGKPTAKSPGFRLLITIFQELSYAGQCPNRFYHCRQAALCIPRQLTCDGKPNCGRDDVSDEAGCDRYDTVTNLLAEYSLTRDIILAIMLPVVVFIGSVVVIILTARRYIRRISKPQLPTVQFSPARGGHVRISNRTEMSAPPTYEDVLDQPTRYELPPSYNGLHEPSMNCTYPSKSSGNVEGRNPCEDLKPSQSLDPTVCKRVCDHNLRSLTEKFDYENYRHPLCPSDSDDDEGLKSKKGRKGEKGKKKGKRKATEDVGIPASECIRAGNPHISAPSTDSAYVSAAADSPSLSASSPELPPELDSVVSSDFPSFICGSSFTINQ